MSTRKRDNTHSRQAKALKRVAFKAYTSGNESRADNLLAEANYWQARAMILRDKRTAADGAVISVDWS